jgi:hypothetical protein
MRSEEFESVEPSLQTSAGCEPTGRPVEVEMEVARSVLSVRSPHVALCGVCSLGGA